MSSATPSQPPDGAGPITGRPRDRRTRWSVRVSDITASVLITVGGIGTIAAVLAVCVFLVAVVWPLFQPAEAAPASSYETPWGDDRTPLQVGVNEYGTLAWSLFDDGALTVFRLDSGEVLERQQLFEGRTLTASSFRLGHDDCAFGYASGEVQLGRIGFAARFRSPDAVDSQYRGMEEGDSVTLPEGVLLTRVPQGFREQSVEVELDDPLDPDPEEASAIRRIGHVIRGEAPVFCALTESGRLHLNSVSIRTNFLTGETIPTVRRAALPLPERDGAAPIELLVSRLGDNVLVTWEDGVTLRYDIRNLNRPVPAEIVDLLPDPEARVTAMSFMLGGATVLVGDQNGRVDAWFRVNRAEAPEPRTDIADRGQLAEAVELEPDAWTMVRSHRLPAGPGAVTAFGSASRSRILAIGYDPGQVRLFHVTTDRALLPQPLDLGEAVREVVINPNDDGLIAVTSGRVETWELDRKHPEVNFKSLFLPVHYEGYPNAVFKWQTSAATDDVEPMFSLTPLIFGTIKATIYSMIFGAPLALLAAIYTSEFLNPKIKARVKPTIELMASLPSVVLGFLFGLVIAPVVEDWIAVTLTAFLTIPLAVLLASYFWQLIPNFVALRIQGLRLPLVTAVIAGGLASAFWLYPLVEGALFGPYLFAGEGDFKLWLDGAARPGPIVYGSPASGWMLMFLPLAAIAVAWLNGVVVNPRMQPAVAALPRPAAALVFLCKFLVGLLLTLGLALGLGVLLGLVLDPRAESLEWIGVDWGPMGNYIQRNALVVGFAMGFAIIPIIYTISEDALSTVPEHLRSGSLGAGATPWQTAQRIVIPTAMSGLFSAMMIGLGRAVGETMIVLMAAGTTPIMDMNIFNGFQTLSVAIANEMPEAPRGSSHYRVLFLAGLTLFVMTFVLNTIAEAVRIRFRKRAFQL